MKMFDRWQLYIAAGLVALLELVSVVVRASGH
jgi:hypothetical protein